MDVLIGIAIWVIIFLVWYVRNYPEKFRNINPLAKIKWKMPHRKRTIRPSTRASVLKSTRDFKSLVETIESISSRDRMQASDAAAMVQAVNELIAIEPASGQLWEALALDSLETAEIICDECRVPVDKMVKKTGVKIKCAKCLKWLALKNSKVTVIDPNRPDLEEWEH